MNSVKFKQMAETIAKPNPLKRQRTGCIYEEFTNPGMIHSAGQFVKGVGLVQRKHRYVAEIGVCGVRFRFRSTNYSNCRAWLDDMIEKFRDL